MSSYTGLSVRWWKRLKRWQKWLIGLPFALLSAFTALVLYVVYIWTPQKSLEEGLGFLLNENVYAEGAARKKLEDYIASHPRARDEAELHTALTRAFELLGDKHAHLVAPDVKPAETHSSEHSGLLTMESYVVGHAVDGTEAKQVKIGDRIVNEEKATLHGQPARTLTLRRGARTLQVTLPIRRRSEQMQPQSRMLSKHVGYYLMPPTALPDLSDSELKPRYRAYVQSQADALEQLQPLCGLVVDLRLNSGGVGFVMAKAASLFLGTGRYISIKSPGGGTQWVGVAPDGTAYQGKTPEAPTRNEHYLQMKVPARANVAQQQPYLAVLTGSDTASAGEIVTIAARQLSRTRTFGEATYGDVTMLISHTLTDGTEMTWSYAFMHDAKGHEYRAGLAPETFVKIRADRFGTSTDPVILAATRWLQEKGCE